MTEPSTAGAASGDDLTARALDLLHVEVEDLFARHEALAATHRRRGEERAADLQAAAAYERAADAAADQAWQAWATTRDQLHEQPGDLARLAAADQAEAHYDSLRETARVAHTAAGELALRLLAESQQDTRELLELGRRAHTAQDFRFAATLQQVTAAPAADAATANAAAGQAASHRETTAPDERR
ncbi:hypothetical protein [Couchioplanes caeruleus]|uniref:Uncharacterized protein n=2 Tax=Couchioplanes caeruleus TaxID=56438 RepID=A0A1K0FEJ7_9ACTN|nr:hypothetical protein [Couchioplanes caeruleus]OJF11249.1 hypothetical protein BG844_27560 [Couchioplanes caeruleus subsp. caeruleus]ROP29405.1 hypothetical protein EDD30_2198 [Couchioplanes caeruleus]